MTFFTSANLQRRRFSQSLTMQLSRIELFPFSIFLNASLTSSLPAKWPTLTFQTWMCFMSAAVWHY